VEDHAAYQLHVKMPHLQYPAAGLAHYGEGLGQNLVQYHLFFRDAFFGVRRFGDFARHLSIPRAVLSERLGADMSAYFVVQNLIKQLFILYVVNNRLNKK